MLSEISENLYLIFIIIIILLNANWSFWIRLYELADWWVTPSWWRVGQRIVHTGRRRSCAFGLDRHSHLQSGNRQYQWPCKRCWNHDGRNESICDRAHIPNYPKPFGCIPHISAHARPAGGWLLYIIVRRWCHKRRIISHSVVRTILLTRAE